MTSTESALDLGPQAAAVARLARSVTDDMLDAPTPCEEMRVGALLVHLLGLSAAFAAAARKDFGPLTDTPPDTGSDALPGDWRIALPRALDALAAAWRDPAATTGTTRAGGVEMPADVMGAVAADELVVHGWDLAVATGQGYEPDPAALAVAHGLLGSAAEGGGSLFGPPVPVPASAPLLDRALGLSGRDPRWSPPAP
ncbi:TIGR03086 family metal-binding protein [Streptomyces sp. NPDC050560]|uniref:TIGR03086 family metal-binding protein n=1 Tax=Streptomyces sp. NPDC050560 TaxID=3365630 RepID=UPI0037BD1584